MGQLLGNQYEIIRTLGKGTMGEVVLVKDLHLERLAAVKQFKKGRQENEVMRKEVRFLKEVKHPNLTDIYDFFEEEDKYCLVMEYVEGITLEQYLKKNKKVDEEQAIIWAVELAEVLNYLHHRKPEIIYCDLKPANIMINSEGKLKLIDLGACRQGDVVGKEENNLVGTLGYMPPEQWKVGGVSKTTDIYALGVVLHEMLTGSAPAGGAYQRRPVREYDRSISPKLERVIIKCTEEEAAFRYQSMESVIEALLYCSKKKILSNICMVTVGGMYIFLWLCLIISLVWPLYRGVPETEIPFPYLNRPMLIAGMICLFRRLILRKQRNYIKKIEKSIFATEKKFDGLLYMK